MTQQLNVQTARGRLSLYLRSSGTLRIVDWQLVTDVSGQHNGPLFKGQAEIA